MSKKIKTRLCQDEMLTKEKVARWILSSEKAVKRAAIVIYDQQKLDEKDLGYSLHIDGIGFNRFDSKFLSSFAIKCKMNDKITLGEMEEARHRLIKYSQQIADITNAKKWIQLEWVI